MDPVLLVFVGLASFVIFRLISVLGTRTGHEQRPDIEGLQRAKRKPEPEAAPTRPVPAAEEPAMKPVSEGAVPLRQADATFDEPNYLAGARAAYEMIVEAFAAGDLKSIRKYVSSSVYEAFRGAVAAREAAGHRVDLKFVGIESANIASSRVEGGQMIAVTDFASNQVRATYDGAGALVDGDAARIDLVKDRWTFARDVSSKDPNWTLIATGGSA